MFGKSIVLFKLLGFEVKINASWMVIAVLLTWSLSMGYFPFVLANRSAATYWAMGVAGALGLFLSIVLHELGHAVVARRQGIRIRGITLFIFGGVAELESEPATPRAEFRMAVAGPAVSVLLAVGFFVLGSVGSTIGWPSAFGVVVQYLAWINAILVVFNMIPAFPLDGGRVLRSILWARRGDLRSGTRTAAKFGSGFGVFLIILGVVSVLSGSILGGVWWFLIGLFLRGASRMSYQQVEIRTYLEGEPIRNLMTRDLVTVPSTISVETLVQDYIYRRRFHWFPVMAGNRLIGYAGTRQVKALPREDWPRMAVYEIIQPCSPDNTTSSDLDAVEALSHMSRSGAGRLLVVDGQKLVGIVSRRDLLRFLAVKLDLEGGPGDASGDAEERLKELQGV